MATRIMKSGNQIGHPGFLSYYVELRSEIQELPTIPEISWGSEAFCLEDSSAWVLSSNGEWKELG